MNEEWRQIPGFPGYEASSLGNVRSWISTSGKTMGAPHTLRPQLQKTGYLRVTLRRDGKSHQMHVHEAVMLAFVGPKPAGNQVRHFPDDSKLNNRADNLLYGTRAQNKRDRIAHGTWGIKLSHDAAAAIKLAAGTQEAIAEMFSVSPSTVRAIKTGKCWAVVLGGQHE